MNRKKNKKMIIAVIVTAAVSLAMIVCPGVSLSATQKALELWMGTVVPALLPFFICAGLMMRLGVPRRMARFFERPVRRFFHVPGCAAFAFIMSITSGYPMGAKITADLREQGEVSKVQAERMLTFCSTSGPLFMLGAVGAGMLGNVAAGWVIAISHYLGAIFNGMIFRHHGKEHEREKSAAQLIGARHEKNPAPALREKGAAQALRQGSGGIVNMLTDSIFSSFKTLLLICGYIVIFTLIIEFLDTFLFFTLFQNDIAASIAKGVFEFTIGCSAVSSVEETAMLTKCVICAAIISWGGISTHFQVASIVGKTDIDTAFYVRTKLCHALLSAMVAFGMGGVIFKMADTSTQTGVFGAGSATPGVFGEGLPPPGVFGEGLLAAGGFGTQILNTVSTKMTEITTGSGILAPARIGFGSFEEAHIFINKLLFSSQMIIMVVILFVIISIVGRMSYQITNLLKRLYIRRKNARERRRKAREERAAKWRKAAAKSSGNRGGIQPFS